MNKGFIIVWIVVNTNTACKTQRVTETKSPLQTQAKSFAGTTLRDTISYLQTEVIDKKKQFVGKELSVLLKNISLKPVAHIYSDVPVNRFISNSISLWFYSAEELRDRTFKKLPNTELFIVWQTPVAKDSAFSLYRKNGGRWSQDVANYYDKQIIGDIILGKYNIEEQ